MGRIKSFEFFRIFMMIAIVLSHLEFLGNYPNSTIYLNYFHNPLVAVDFFFVLSGFGMMYSSYRVEKVTLKSSVQFAIQKIKKIFPIYVFSLLIGIPHYLMEVCYRFGNIEFSTVLTGIGKSIVYFVCDLTLLQSATGITKYSHSLNGVCWFVSTLFILYLLTPILVKIIEKLCGTLKKTWIVVISNFVIIVVLYKVLQFVDQKTVFDELSYTSPLFRVFFFTEGMAILKLVSFLKTRKYDLTIYEILVCIVNIVWFFMRATLNVNDLLSRTVDVLLACLIIFVFAFDQGKVSAWMAKSRLQNLSGYVMYLYLLHYPVRMTLIRVLDTYHFYVGPYTGIIEVFLCLSISVIFTIVAKQVFEQIRKKRQQRGDL